MASHCWRMRITTRFRCRNVPGTTNSRSPTLTIASRTLLCSVSAISPSTRATSCRTSTPGPSASMEARLRPRACAWCLDRNDRIKDPALLGVGDIAFDAGDILPDVYSGTFSFNGGALEAQGVRLVFRSERSHQGPCFARCRRYRLRRGRHLAGRLLRDLQLQWRRA